MGLENLPKVKRLLLLGLVASVGVAAAVSERAAATPLNHVVHRNDADSVIIAVGGTPFTNGIFAPGTAIDNGNGLEGVPLIVQKGNNVTFINLDPYEVANAHKIRSFKRKKGRPVFQSPTVKGPGQTSMRTSHLKPGVYGFFCPIHTTMYGLLEVR